MVWEYQSELHWEVPRPQTPADHAGLIHTTPVFFASFQGFNQKRFDLLHDIPAINAMGSESCSPLRIWQLLLLFARL
jgi:hypothetical protein